MSEACRSEIRSRRNRHDMGPIPLMINPVKSSEGRLCANVTIPSQRGRLPNH